MKPNVMVTLGLNLIMGTMVILALGLSSAPVQYRTAPEPTFRYTDAQVVQQKEDARKWRIGQYTQDNNLRGCNTTPRLTDTILVQTAKFRTSVAADGQEFTIVTLKQAIRAGRAGEVWIIAYCND